MSHIYQRSRVINDETDWLDIVTVGEFYNDTTLALKNNGTLYGLCSQALPQFGVAVQDRLFPSKSLTPVPSRLLYKILVERQYIK